MPNLLIFWRVHINLRTPPGRDDKILADWNGLVIAALARLAPIFQNKNWLDKAEEAFEGVLHIMSYEDAGFIKLAHAVRKDSRLNVSMAEDYANMTDAALALFSATGRADYLSTAETLIKTLEHFYADGLGGFYMTASGAEALIARPIIVMTAQHQMLTGPWLIYIGGFPFLPASRNIATSWKLSSKPKRLQPSSIILKCRAISPKQKTRAIKPAVSSLVTHRMVVLSC